MTKSSVCLLAQLVILPILSAISYAEHFAVVKSADIRPYNEAVEGFKSSCNYKITEISIADEHAEIAKEVLRINPDGIIAIGMNALGQLKNVTDLPLVYAMIPDPRSSGALGKNISGVNMTVAPERHLSSMLEIFPAARRIGVIYDPRNSDQFVEEALKYAQSREVELVLKKAGRAGEVPVLMDGMKKVDVIWMLPDPTVINQESVKFMLLFSFQNKIPVFTFSKKYVEMGAVAGLNITPFEMGAQACELLKKSTGVKGAAIPIRVDARKAVLVVNSKIAKKMGIRIKEDVLRRSEDVN